MSDIILCRYKAVIFLNGCYLFKWPETRKKFWECTLKGKNKMGCEKVIAIAGKWLNSSNSYIEIS